MDAPLEPPEWLDREPEVLWGCTQPELMVLLAGALALAVPVGFLFALYGRIGAISVAYLAIPLTGGLVYALVRIGAFWTRLLKRGRPDHFYRLRIHLWLARRGLARERFIQRSGAWDIRRI